MAWVFPEFKFKWLVEESKKNIPRELDFTEEAKNTMKVKKMFQHFSWLKVSIIKSVNILLYYFNSFSVDNIPSVDAYF